MHRNNITKESNDSTGGRRLRIETISDTSLKYLKLIFLMASSGTYAKLSMIASLLGVSVPAVSMAVRRLENQGLVEADKRRGVKLTPKGLNLVIRHCVKRMMIDSSLGALGIPMPLVKVMSRILEYGLDDDSVLRLWSYVGCPRVCPLGNPIFTFEDIPNIDVKEFAKRASICCHMKELVFETGA